MVVFCRWLAFLVVVLILVWTFFGKDRWDHV